MTVVWNGTMEREAAEALRRPAPPIRTMTVAQQDAIDHLSAHPETTVGELIDAIGCDRSEMRGVLNHLCAAGRIKQGSRTVRLTNGWIVHAYVVVET